MVIYYFKYHQQIYLILNYHKLMSIITFIGKLLLSISIAFEGYVLFTNPNAGKQFNQNLNSAIKSCNCSIWTPQVVGLLNKYLIYFVAPNLISSLVMLVPKLNISVVKIPIILSLGILFWLEHHDSFKNFPDLANSAFWQALGVIGAVIYLLGAEWKQKAPAQQSKKPESQEKQNNKKKN